MIDDVKALTLFLLGDLEAGGVLADRQSDEADERGPNHCDNDGDNLGRDL